MSRKAKNDKSKLTAVKMRYILVATLVGTIAFMAIGVYFAYSVLGGVAAEASQVLSRAASADAEQRYISELEKKLEEYSVARDRAQQIVAESQSYRYQDQVIQDLTQYANRAGLQIASFTFQSAEPAGAQAAPPPAQGDGSAAPAEDGSIAPAPAAAIQSTIVSVQLSEPVAYRNLLHFLHLIEENLTRMQITQLSLSPGESASTVSAQTLNIEVYLR